jgi:hypothetical protein
MIDPDNYERIQEAIRRFDELSNILEPKISHIIARIIQLTMEKPIEIHQLLVTVGELRALSQTLSHSKRKIEEIQNARRNDQTA